MTMAWNPDSITNLATAYWQSATLIAAIELRLFDHLDQPAEAKSIALLIEANVESLTHLLDALVSIDLLSKDHNVYSIQPSAKPYLTRSSPTSLLDALSYNADLYKQWTQLAAIIKSGQPIARKPLQLGADPSLTRRFVAAMESKARAFLPSIVPHLNLNGQQTLLDVGCGPGTISRYFAQQKPKLDITLLDLPDILKITCEYWNLPDLQNRVNYLPANYRTDSIEQQFEAIIYAGALHQETESSASALISKLHRSLSPGGKLFIIDLMLDDNRSSPGFSALFQLNMLLIQPGARVFSQSQVRNMLLENGMEVVETSQPESSPYRIVSACKSKQ